MFPLSGDRKGKPPKGFSYVSATQELSRVFAAVPQAEDLVIWFSRSTRRDCTEAGTQYPVFAARYEVHYVPSAAVSRRREDRHFGCAHWYLDVHVVRSDVRATVRSLLLSIGYPNVIGWLSTPRPETWYMSRHRIECLFDDISALSFRER